MKGKWAIHFGSIFMKNKLQGKGNHRPSKIIMEGGYPRFKSPKSKTGATGSITRSKKSIKKTPNNVRDHNPVTKNEAINPVIKTKIHQLTPIRRGTSRNLIPRASP